MYRHTIPSLLSKFFPKLIWNKPNDEQKIYLTFDDGPHPEITLKVLEILAIYKAKATFFVVGENAQKFPKIIQQILEKGNAIGNHTFNHLKGWNTSNENYFKNIERCDVEIKTQLFRPPYGRIKISQANEILKEKKVIMWSLLTRDYEKNLNLEKTFQNICKKTKSGDIIVFHDSEKAAKNMLALLPKYLDFCNKKGFVWEVLE